MSTFVDKLGHLLKWNVELAPEGCQKQVKESERRVFNGGFMAILALLFFLGVPALICHFGWKCFLKIVKKDIKDD